MDRRAAALRCRVRGEIECEQDDPGHLHGDGPPEQVALPFAEPAAAALEHQRGAQYTAPAIEIASAAYETIRIV